MEDFIVGFLAATLRIATPLMFGTLGELFCERAGILNLGIEGTMFFGAFVGFAAAAKTGSLMIGLLAAILAGILAGLLMSLLTVILGVNQHVSGLGITLLLTALAMFGFNLIFGANRVLPSIESFPQIKLLGDIPILGEIFTQYGLTYVAILLIPLCAWVLYHTSFGLNLRSVGQNPEATDCRRNQRLRTAYRCFDDRWRIDFGRWSVPLAGATGYLYFWYYQWPRLGVHRSDHLCQLGTNSGLLGGTPLRWGIRAAVTAAIDRPEAAL